MRMMKNSLHLILSLKVLNVILINYLFLLVLFLYLSKFYIDTSLLDVYRNEYLMNYLFESMLILKINVVVLVVYLVMNGKRVMDNCYLFLKRVSLMNFYLSYVISILAINYNLL